MRPLPFALLSGSFMLVRLTSSPSTVATFAGGQAEALGVCEARPDYVACWSPTGAASPSLTDTFRFALANGGEASFRFGKKNRYLAVRHPAELAVNYRAANDSLSPSLYGNGEPRTEFLRVTAGPTEGEITIQASVTIANKEEPVLPLREGAKATIDGRSVEVGAAQKVSAKKRAATVDPQRFYGYSPNPPTGDYWTFVIGLEGREGEYVNWSYTPLDSAGTPIRYVDVNGRPLSAIKALALEPTLQSANGYNGFPNGGPSDAPKPKAVAAYFRGVGPVPAFRATTNIDPRCLASVRVRTSHVETADLGPFTLDPK